MRILVAEDERVTRATLVRQLKALGHDVTEAADGAAAWEAFNAGPPFDMVVTDWEMPGLSGLELVGRVRAAQLASYVYVILLTGRSGTQDVVSGIEAGADDYIPKPFEKEELRVRILAGERVVRLERALKERNADLQTATDRMRRDLHAAARVQKAMLPRGEVVTDRVKTAWAYVPTDELAGDALGIDLIDDRYLVSYVLDVSGHGVPAALLSVTAMHALAPAGTAIGVIRSALALWSDAARRGEKPADLIGPVISDLNRRFASTDNDGRFVTMVFSVLDTHTGLLSFTRAAHPVPILLRDGACVPVDDAGGVPLALYDGEQYPDVHVQLKPGDRFICYSDGINEQLRGGDGNEQFGVERLEKLVQQSAARPAADFIVATVAELYDWAGSRSLKDDVSLLVIDWLG